MNRYVTKYNKKSDYYMVDLPTTDPMINIIHDTNKEAYQQHTGLPSNYLPTNHVLLPTQQHLQHPLQHRQVQQQNRRSNKLSEFC